MSQLNPLEIYKLLPKSNCSQCQVPTCMAFAAAVIRGIKSLDNCPHLERNIIERFDGKIEKRMDIQQQRDQYLEQLKKEIPKIDFSSSAERLGASLSGGKLKIKCLGRDFIIDSKGNITSGCHIHTWVTVPLLNYVLSSAGNNVSGKWVPFRELKGGMKWNPLFEQRCEKPLKQIADTHTDLFEDILYIFGGRPAEISFTTDISLILRPLPKVPILICYCKPEDELESKLNVFFDVTAEDNLSIELIYIITTGLVVMFEKIIHRHS
ncbi:MAG: DUF3786 domain-containing protein [Eubacteriales bacterium]